MRFPPILRIEAETPVKFQEAIRQDYPLFEEKREGIPNIPKELLGQVPKELRRLLGTPERKAYTFSSLDEQWTISLTREFLALTSNDYIKWETFQEHFINPFEALIREYNPALFTRIGLRYQNVIRPRELGLENTPWSELLQPYIAGILASDSDLVAHSVLDSMQVLEVRLQQDYGRVQIRHGFAVDNETDETLYVIDSDFFTEKLKEKEDVINRLQRFNRRAGRLFRWCITNKLHEAMVPTDISDI